MTGFFGVERHQFIECAENGVQWEKKGMFGDIFPTLHVGAVIMHAVVVVIIFSRIPRSIHFPQSKSAFITKEDIDHLKKGSSPLCDASELNSPLLNQEQNESFDQISGSTLV